MRMGTLNTVKDAGMNVTYELLLDRKEQAAQVMRTNCIISEKDTMQYLLATDEDLSKCYI